MLQTRVLVATCEATSQMPCLAVDSVMINGVGVLQYYLFPTYFLYNMQPDPFNQQRSLNVVSILILEPTIMVRVTTGEAPRHLDYS